MAQLQQRVDGRIQLTIPDFPIPPLPLEEFSGADPLVSVGTVNVVAGTNVVVPVNLDEVAGLESIQLTLHYPDEYLVFSGVTQVGVTADFQYRSIHHEAGTIVIDVSRLEPVGSTGASTLFELGFHVSSDTPTGELLIDLAEAALNDTALTLNPEPQPGADPTDGKIVVSPKPETTVRGLLPRILDQVKAVFASVVNGESASVEAQMVEPLLVQAAPTSDVVRSIAAMTTETSQQTFDGEPRSWLQGFVNPQDAAAGEANPNTGLKVVLSASTRVDAKISSLERD